MLKAPAFYEIFRPVARMVGFQLGNVVCFFREHVTEYDLFVFVGTKPFEENLLVVAIGRFEFVLERSELREPQEVVLQN